MKIFGWLVRRYQLETMFRGEVRLLQIDAVRDCTGDIMDTTLRALNASAKRRQCKYRFRAAGPSQIIKRRIWQRKVWVRPESFQRVLRAIRHALHWDQRAVFAQSDLPDILRVRYFLQKSGVSFSLRERGENLVVCRLMKKSEKIV